MKLLVTGGAGFIGSAFVRRRLAHTADTIVVLDKLTYAGNRRNLQSVDEQPALASRMEFVRGDIADTGLVESLTGDIDAIVNFAAESHVDRSILDSEAFLRTGVIGVHVLLEAVRHSGRRTRFVQVSTDEVYGSVDEGASREDDPLATQFPEKFPGRDVARSRAADLRIALDRLLGEHAFLASEATRAAISGGQDVEAAKTALDANSADLANALAGSTERRVARRSTNCGASTSPTTSIMSAHQPPMTTLAARLLWPG